MKAAKRREPDLLSGGNGGNGGNGGSGAVLFAADHDQGDDQVLDFNGAAGDRLALGTDNIGRPYSWDTDVDGNLALSLAGPTLTLVGISATTDPGLADNWLVFF